MPIIDPFLLISEVAPIKKTLKLYLMLKLFQTFAPGNYDNSTKK